MSATRPLRPTLIGQTPGARVPVYLRPDIATLLPRLLGKVPASTTALVVVTDMTVARLHLGPLNRALTAAGWRVDRYVLPPGERIKTRAVVDSLHERWFRQGYDRSTPVIAFGGGTVGDAAGFAAATFMRGLPLWQAPTTIVGQVDSALGGKVGINHRLGKNLIGCFYQPTGVVIDPTLLATLPSRELRAGLAEVVKYGVIDDPALFETCERRLPSWVRGDRPIDAAVIAACAAIKLRIVEADEHDRGLRHRLNFGHTLGHALEAWGKYRIFRHGEAVTLGMVGVASIAAARGVFPSSDLARLESLCRPLAPSIWSPRFVPEAVIAHLALDKKRQGGRNTWLLPRRIGAVASVRDVADNEIVEALRYVRRWLDSTK
ncbi:MAG TPA: 3-dehydroquinate synthase [bacterium]|nr:3-dehydroquinate synthase [bacterium]